MTQTFDNIASVYSGKIVTWCGCSAGTHTDASTNKTPRDYLNTDDAKVKHVWDKVFGGKHGAPKIEGSHAYIEIGRRLYIVYFND